MNARKIQLPRIDPRQVSEEIGAFVVDRVRSVHASGCVVGLSGGVDSSTCAALVQSAFARHRRRTGERFELVGYLLPSHLNQPDDTRDAEAVARLLQIRHAAVDLQPVVAAFAAANPEAFGSHYHRGNLISRIRAVVLNTKAATENKIVAGTGNKDEDFGIGYYTLFGDGAVHLSPIAGLSKRLVREVARFLGLPEAIVSRTPTAGLEPDQSDFKDLGYDYDVVELVTEGLDQGLDRDEILALDALLDLIAVQLRRYRESFGQPRHATAAAVVDDIIRRHDGARRKMEIIHPPTPAITLRYD